MTASRSSALIGWLLLGVIGLIVYGSLYPFNFKPDAIEGGIVQALGQLSWARAGRSDRIANVLLYLPLGFCLFLLLSQRLRAPWAMLWCAALGALFSLSIEVAQVYVSVRVPSFTDLSLNTLGALLGAIGGFAWRQMSTWMHLPTRVEKPTRDASAAMVIGLWLLWRFAPFVPHVDLGKLKAALRPLFAPQFDAVAILTLLSCWLVVSQAIAALVSRARMLEVLLVLIAIVLVGRLVLVNQALNPNELLALLLLLPALIFVNRMTPAARRAMLVATMVVVLLLDRLAPFQWSPDATPFDFRPFLPWFDAGLWQSLKNLDWPALCGKIFLFGALLWVIRQRGTSVNVAAVTMLSLVLLTEILQRWLPGQSASITDPLLAAIIALLFRYVHLKTRREPRMSTARHARSL